MDFKKLKAEVEANQSKYRYDFKSVNKVGRPIPVTPPWDAFFPYQYFRQGQPDALDRIWSAFEKGKRFVILEAGTGAGKSAMAQAIANRHKSSYLACSQRMLQDQYARDMCDNSLAGTYIYSPQVEIDPAFLKMSDKELNQAWAETRGTIVSTLPIPENGKRDVALLKGKSNYSCQRYGTEENAIFHCGNAPCVIGEPEGEKISEKDKNKWRRALKLDCVSKGICPFYNDMFKALAYRKTLTNFKNQLLLSQFKVFKQRELMIVDEAHLLEGNLFEFVEITMTPDTFEPVMTFLTLEDQELLKSGIKTGKEAVDFLKRLEPKVANVVEYYDMNGGSKTAEEAEKEEAVHELYFKIQNFLRLVGNPDDLVVTPNMHTRKHKDGSTTQVQKGVRIKPLTVKHLFPLPFISGQRVLLMSATILDAKMYCSSLGIPIEEVEFIQMDSTFPVENHPFLYRPVGSMGRHDIERTLPKMVEEVAKILYAHPEHKGLIHTVNFRPITETLLREIGREFKDRLLVHANGADKFDLIKQHTESKEPTVLVGPGFAEGLDLKDDLARFIIFMKVPYLSLADAVTKKRMELEAGWYQWQTALSLVQMAGRACRSESDYAISYMLDSNFKMFWDRGGKTLVPPYFRKSVMRDA